MGYLKKIEALRISKDGKIDVEDIFREDPKFKSFLESTVHGLKLFSAHFNVDEDKILEIIYNQTKDY